MLTLTQLGGFGSGGGGTDVTPDAFAFNDITDQGPVASAATNVVTISGIDTTITLLLTIEPVETGNNMTQQRVVSIYRNGSIVKQGTEGYQVDVTITNGQTLRYQFTNSDNGIHWLGVAKIKNVTDGGIELDAFSYDLYDTGTIVGVGVGGGGVGGPIP